MAPGAVRTTLAIPRNLLEKADELVKQGEVRSRNELIAMALRRELNARERARIDAQIRLMAFDEEYQREADQIDEEFKYADWESIKDLEPYKED